MLLNTPYNTLFNLFNLFIYYNRMTKKVSGIVAMNNLLSNR